MRPAFRPVTLAAWLAAATVPCGAYALPPSGGTIKIDKNDSGFNPTAVVRDGGRLVRLGGPINCTKDGGVTIDVTLTQRRTGSIGRHRWRGTCRGTTQQWTLRSLRASGSARFEPGRAQACAATVARNASGPTDAVQWCSTVRLRRA